MTVSRKKHTEVCWIKMTIIRREYSLIKRNIEFNSFEKIHREHWIENIYRKERMFKKLADVIFSNLSWNLLLLDSCRNKLSSS